MAIEMQLLQPARFDLIHANGGARRGAPLDFGIAPEVAIGYDRGQAVEVGDVVDLALHRAGVDWSARGWRISHM